jgi:hypothetical protein
MNLSPSLLPSRLPSPAPLTQRFVPKRSEGGSLLLAASVFWILTPNSWLLAATPVESRLTAATVYADRAVVTRSAHLDSVPAGATELTFENLPANLNTASLQVTGRGPANATILDVSAKTVRTEATAVPGEKAIEDKIKSLRDQDRALADKARLLDRQRGLLAQIEAAATRPPPAPTKDAPPAAAPPSFDDWQKLLDFSADKTKALAESQRTLDDARQTLADQIAAQESALRDLRGTRPGARSTTTVTVRLTAAQAGALDLSLSYALPGANWSPVYDARLRTERRELELGYFALVRNSTGEDWKDIALTLSTARPSLGGGVTEPAAWTLDVGVASQSPNRSIAEAFAVGAGPTILPIINNAPTFLGVRDISGANNYVGGTASNFGILSVNGGALEQNAIRDTNGAVLPPGGRFIEYGGSNVAVAPGTAVPSPYYMYVTPTGEQIDVGRLDLAYASAGLQTGATSATFKIDGATTLPSDNAPQRVAITSFRLPALLQYQATPRASESVYLTAYANNGSDYPLLAGALNAFLDDNLIASSRLDTVMPAARLHLALGADEGITFKRRVVPRFSEDSGFTGKYRRVTYEFAYTITNHKKTTERVMFKDVLPLSRDERIVVKLEEPRERDLLKPEDIVVPGALPKPGITKEEDGKLVWRLDVKPGEKIERTLKFTVEYPADVPVTGLQ